MASILVTNIIDYVGLCERLHGVNMINFLNENYFATIHKYILKFNGKIDALVADRQLAFWDTKNDFNNIMNACKAAIQIKDELNGIIVKLNWQSYNFSIAMVTGDITTINNMIVGDKVTTCMRMVDLCERYNVQVLIDQMSIDLCKALSVKEIATVKINGKINLIKVYELLYV